MAQTVSSYQQAAFTTPTNGTQGDASVVLSNDNTLRAKFNSHDADGALHVQSSVLASRPAGGTLGRFWVTTDGKRAYLDNGATFDELAYLPTAGGTVTGSLAVGTTLGVTGAASFFNTVTVNSGLTSVQALQVNAGLTVTGNSTVTGTLGVSSTLTVSAGGVAVTGNSTVTGRFAVSAQGEFGAWDGVAGADSQLRVSNDTTASATAGAASLPAAPVGFLTWKRGSTTIKVPYYNA